MEENELRRCTKQLEGRGHKKKRKCMDKHERILSLQSNNNTVAFVTMKYNNYSTKDTQQIELNCFKLLALILRW
jgi:hypothetical protein